MPHMIYDLSNDPRQLLDIDWEPYLNNLHITLGGQLLDTVSTRAEMEIGKTYTMEDGSILFVQVVDNELEVSLDAKLLLPRTKSPTMKLRLLYRIMLVLSGLSLFASLVIGGSQTHDAIFSWKVAAAYNLLMLLVTVWFWQKRSGVALGIVIGMIAFDVAMAFYEDSYGAGTFVRIGLVYMLFQGFQYLKAERDIQKDSEIQQIGS